MNTDNHIHIHLEKNTPTNNLDLQKKPPRGPTGATGRRGLTGAIGSTGVRGPTGVRGSSGTQGSTGVRGSSGVAGILGASGPTGVEGSIGVVGPTGVVGPIGEIGPTGLEGPTGDQGATGVTSINQNMESLTSSNYVSTLSLYSISSIVTIDNELNVNSTLMNSLRVLSLPEPEKFTYITIESPSEGEVTSPSWASYVKITNIAGGGKGGDGGGENGTTGGAAGAGGGSGGTIIYTTSLNNYVISYNLISTIGGNNYSTCVVSLSNTNNIVTLYSIYGSNTIGGSGCIVYSEPPLNATEILIPGNNGYSNRTIDNPGFGIFGGKAQDGGGGGAGGGQGAGPHGGVGAPGSGGHGGDGGVGSGGGGSSGILRPGGAGGPPLITFEWL
jgi:hypothetical protein